MKYCECTLKQIVDSQWKSFGIDPSKVKKINDYETNSVKQSEAKEKCINYVKSFEEIRGQRENGISLLGQSGAGKTHLIIAVGAALISKNVKVIYMPYLEALQEIKSNVLDEQKYNQLMWRYQRADLLIIDDLFKDKLKDGKVDKKLNEADIKHLYSIVNYRYINNLPTITSSEADPSGLIELDEAIAGRLLESSGNRIVIFNDKKYNYRLGRWRK